MGKAVLALTLCFWTLFTRLSGLAAVKQLFFPNFFLWSASSALPVPGMLALESLVYILVGSMWGFEHKANAACVSAHESLHPGTTHWPATQARV